jgi:large subunit ribosomal protein L10
MYKTAVKHKINKKEVVERLKQKILSSSVIIIANYQGLNVAQITEFRRELAKNNAKFEVVRQKLFEIALRNTKCEEIKTFISNAIGIITCSDEEKVLDVTKYLIEYAKQNNKFKILGGYLYDRICDPAKINEIANLPSKIELIAKLIQLLNSPINRLCLTLKSPLTSLINILSTKSSKGG